MSERFPGGIVTKNPATPTGPFESGAAPGIWTLDQQMQFKQQGVWPTAGLQQPNYIEDVFSTWLYVGNGSTQTITNGIDLAGKGGLTWIKDRTIGLNHALFDTVRGVINMLQTDNSSAQSAQTGSVTAFNTNGFTVNNNVYVNNNTTPYVSWTFRKQPKFFDVVTYTGNGTTQNIAHNLGSTPGFIVVKSLSIAQNWVSWHNSIPTGTYLLLNRGNSVASDGGTIWGNNTTYVAPTSTQFTIGSSQGCNESGTTYVAYLFAHNAGGFGLTGTDNVISCGSYVGNSGTQNITLGYEPQWVLVKNAKSAGFNWQIYDVMRGMSVTDQFRLFPNTSDAESNGGNQINPTATGFYLSDGSLNINGSFETYIYIAIRRGPMKVPTSGTSVFAPIARTGTGSIATVNVGFAPDFLTTFYRIDVGQDKVVFDRLRGPTQYLNPAATTAEINVSTNGLVSFNNTSFTTNAYGYANNLGSSFVNHVFGRAPSFFDEVCYTGNSTSGTTITHNLGVAPELIIVKQRNASRNWIVGNTSVGWTKFLQLNSTTTPTTQSDIWTDTGPTSTVFTVGSSVDTNQSGSTYVAYLFATCAGVSKVGSYTGNGSTQTINCGFTGGARFVLIKRTDATGDWYVYDTARGMTSGTDPYLLLNSSAPEVATAGSVTTVATGFALNSAVLAAINVSAGTYVFLAVA